MKHKWSDLQSGTKERNTKYKKEKRRTGGGPPPQEMSQQGEQILNVIGSTGVEGIIGGVGMAGEIDDIETMSTTSETSSVASSVTNSVKLIRESGLNMSLHSQDADFHDLGMMDRVNEAAVESMVKVNSDGFLSPRNLKETDTSETSGLQFLRPNKTINPGFSAKRKATMGQQTESEYTTILQVEREKLEMEKEKLQLEKRKVVALESINSNVAILIQQQHGATFGNMGCAYSTASDSMATVTNPSATLCNMDTGAVTCYPPTSREFSSDNDYCYNN